MVFLTKHEECIKARLCFAFKNQFILSYLYVYTYSTILYKPWLSLNFFFFFVPKTFWSFLVFLNLENLCYSSFSFPSPFAKINLPRTNLLNSFCVSLLPFPKEQRTNRLNSFVSPFSLVKEFKMTQSENSFDSSLFHLQKISSD